MNLLVCLRCLLLIHVCRRHGMAAQAAAAGPRLLLLLLLLLLLARRVLQELLLMLGGSFGRWLAAAHAGSAWREGRGVRWPSRWLKRKLQACHPTSSCPSTHPPRYRAAKGAENAGEGRAASERVLWRSPIGNRALLRADWMIQDGKGMSGTLKREANARAQRARHAVTRTLQPPIACLLHDLPITFSASSLSATPPPAVRRSGRAPADLLLLWPVFP